MLNFAKLTLNDIETVRPFLRFQKSRICDYSVGGIFMWREYFKTQFTIFRNTLLFKVRYLNGTTAFTVPIGENQQEALIELEGYCRENFIPLVFCTVPDNSLGLLAERYPRATVKQERNWYDYLYRTQDLIDLKGRKYDGQRNHIHKFHKLYPNFLFKKINEENLTYVKDFYAELHKSHQKPSPIAKEESYRTAELLDNYKKYGLFGGCIVTDETIVSMSIGERVNDTLFVHVEKADTRYQGVYQVTVQEFLKYFAGESDTFVNREEDVGDAGLRKSKLSYHPAELLKKSTVQVNI